MTESPDIEAESDAVMAFIRDHQATVLRESIVALEASSLEDLPRTVHALHGSLGSYRLFSAHEHIAALANVLADPATSAEAAHAAQRGTVAALRAEQSSLRSGSEQSA